MKTKKLVLFVSVLLIIFLLIFLLLCKIFYPWRDPSLKIEEVNSVLMSQLEKEGKNYLAIYPDSKEIIVKKGGQSSFYFSYRNPDEEFHFYNYNIVFKESNCGIDPIEAQEYLPFRREGSFELNSGENLQVPFLIQFSVPKNAPSWLINYELSLSKDYQEYIYDSVIITLKIK